jgi:serine/threonine protein kinase
MTLEDSDAAADVLGPVLARARIRVGSVLRGKWRLDALLGVGGMAAVYAATHRNGSRAAVKVLHTEWSVNPPIRSRFLREGYVANKVAHDGAVKIIDDDVAEDGALFLVTELLDGETLDDRRTRLGGRLPEDDVLSVADQLLDVLAAAHSKGVVHRDLKPENLFLTRTGVVKVLDFGIARLHELSTASTATQGGSTMGTPAFMAPEQARGLWDEVDAQSDLWAVGATMFNLLTGKLVHDGRTSNEQLLSAMTNAAPPLGLVLPDTSPAVAHVVDRALAVEKSQRWADAHRMQEAVRGAYYDRTSKPITTAPRLTVPDAVPNRTIGTTNGTTGQPVARTRIEWTRPSRRALTIGGAAFLAIAAVIAVAVVSSGRKGVGIVPGAPSAAETHVAAVAATIPIAPGSAPARASLSSVPEVAATDLPTAKLAPVMPAKAKPAVPLPTATPTAAATCSPPFVIDPNSGKKRWKSECL